MRKGKISEKLVITLWQSCLNEETVADTGDLVKVIYPGRQSDDSGPDFHDAVILFNGKVVKGDIEIHTDSSNWFRHHHHQDSQYNRTILQVVHSHNCNFTATTEQGTRIPTICISVFSNRWPKNLCKSTHTSFRLLPCSQIHKTKSKDFVSLLEIAGRKRFELKADRFRENLHQEGAEQTLLSGIMRALGYSRNTKPFEELAISLAPGFLNQLKSRHGITVQQAYLLGTAGLLPYQRQQKRIRDREAMKLERLWQSLGMNQTMDETDWQFAGVRPHNFPVRRLIALSHILHRYSQSKLPHKILKLATQAPLSSGHLFLERNLVVRTNGYWAIHFDFGVATKASSALLGRSKVAELIINVILPFTYAWADMSGEAGLREKAGYLFGNYPRLADNEITRHMRHQLHLRDLSDIFLIHQQGLIHIFNAYCREGNCQKCPIVNCPH